MIIIQMHPDPDQMEIMESMLAENPLLSFSPIAKLFSASSSHQCFAAQGTDLYLAIRLYSKSTV